MEELPARRNVSFPGCSHRHADTVITPWSGKYTGPSAPDHFGPCGTTSSACSSRCCRNDTDNASPANSRHPGPERAIPLSGSGNEARALLAERLKNGAAKQEFTIRLSSGHERSLYIFLDPECPNCRIFEPTVQALAEDYNVEIFPVTLIGKTRTADEVVPLLCAAPEKRAEMWKSLYDTGAGMLNLTDKAKADVASAACDAGKLALARNDLAFELYRMPGTPTVISDDGRMIPLQAMASDAALKSFLNTRQ